MRTYSYTGEDGKQRTIEGTDWMTTIYNQHALCGRESAEWHWQPMLPRHYLCAKCVAVYATLPKEQFWTPSGYQPYVRDFQGRGEP
jgi:hypothetical protein